jgi:hypothetical protein
MPKLSGQLLAELDDRRPDSVQGLQNQRRSGCEQSDEFVVADLVGDAGTNSAGSAEHLVRQGRPVLGDPEKGRTQTAFGDELVDRISVE